MRLGEKDSGSNWPTTTEESRAVPASLSALNVSNVDSLRGEANTNTTDGVLQNVQATTLDPVTHGQLDLAMDSNISSAAPSAAAAVNESALTGDGHLSLHRYAKEVFNATLGNLTLENPGRDRQIGPLNLNLPEDAIGAADGLGAVAKDRVLSMDLLNGTKPTVSSLFGYLNDSWSNATEFNVTVFPDENSTMGLDRVGLPPGFQYPYLSGYTWIHIILAAIVVSVIIVFIVVGNAMVIIAVSQDRNLNQVQNYFIASLAMSDLLLGLLIMPLSLANELMGYWHFGEMLCDMWLSVDVLLCTASILNLCLISLDRYWSVTRAVSYVRQRTRKRAFIMIAMVWLLSAMICFPPLAGWKRPQPSQYGFDLCMLSEEVGYVVYSVMGSFYIPLAVMVIVYFKIYLAARSRARRNLRKKIPIPIATNNGKSTSSSTTTSFSQQTKGVNTNMTSVKKDSFSGEGDDDEIEEMPPAMETHGLDMSGTGTDSFDPDPVKGQGIKMCVTNHNAHFKPMDEKKKLLSEDTDTDACETPTRQHLAARALTPKRIHFSEDTEDSAPEYLYCNQYTDYRDSSPAKGHSASEDNLKPLLEDSQVESESQRDSDRNGNSKVRTEDQNPPTYESATREAAAAVPTLQVQSSLDVPDKGTDNTPQKKKRKSKTYFKPNGTDAKKKMDLLSPNSIRKLSLRRHAKDKPATREDPDRLRRKIARAKERRAILVLGIIMVTFIICWLPFFSLYLISILSGLEFPRMVFAVIFWAGYCNSALNPIIYTIFNREFRMAFQKMLCGRRCR